MSGSTVVVPWVGAGLFIFCPVPEISWLNPPLQGYVYKTDASGHDITRLYTTVRNRVSLAGRTHIFGF
jgi:hypothetical protein